MMKKGDNMKRNVENLIPLVQKMCDDINELHIKEYPTLTEYNTYFEVARKYIKVITDSGIFILCGVLISQLVPLINQKKQNQT